MQDQRTAPAYHPDFYPCTDEVRWEPLQRHVPYERLGEFMFMMADPAGRFYYKHTQTREYVIANDSGEVWDRGGLLTGELDAP